MTRVADKDRSFQLTIIYLFSIYFQQIREIGERSLGDCWPYFPIGIIGGEPFSVERAGVLVIVAVDAEKFPVAAIGRVVLVIVIFVVNRQFAQVFSGEITTAFSTNPW